MANICSDRVVFYSNEHPNNIKKLIEDIKHLYQSCCLPYNCIDRLIWSNGILNPIPTFGQVVDYDTGDDKSITLSVEADWKPLIRVYKAIANHYGVSFALRSEEPDSAIYVNTDENGEYFVDKYIAHIDGDADTIEPNEIIQAMDFEDQKFQTLESMLEYFSEFGLKASTIVVLNKLLEEKEAGICAYKYALTYEDISYTFIDKTYKVLLAPLTKDELRGSIDEDNFIEGVIQISLSCIIDNDFETFLDLISEALIGSPCLMDVNYSVVGCTDDDVLLLLVRGQVDLEIEDLAEE